VDADSEAGQLSRRNDWLRWLRWRFLCESADLNSLAETGSCSRRGRLKNGFDPSMASQPRNPRFARRHMRLTVSRPRARDALTRQLLGH
jgi:hypothetical protein